MATPKKKRAPKKSKKAGAAKTRGLEATKVVAGDPPSAVQALTRQIEKEGGAVIGTYRDLPAPRLRLKTLFVRHARPFQLHGHEY